MFDADDDKFADPHAPPAEACEVRCLHCGAAYDSESIEWRPLDGRPLEGAWCCPTPGCIAVGFGFDILPIEFVEDDDADEDVDDEASDLAFDVFDDDAFWLDLRALTARPVPRVGNTPQPPFSLGSPTDGLFAGGEDADDEWRADP